MADQTPEEIQAEKEAAEKKEAEEKAAAEAAAAKKEPKVEVENGMVKLSQQDYDNLVGMKGDMITYKDRMRKAEKDMEEKTAADLKAKEEQQIKDKEFEDLFEKEKQKNVDMQTKFKNQDINNAIMVKAMKEGIKKGDYVKLIDKSVIKMDDDTGEISGVDEVMESFKKDNPDLFGTETAPGVDTSKGTKKSGVLSDDEVRNLPASELRRIKKEDPATFKRWKKICEAGAKIPEGN